MNWSFGKHSSLVVTGVNSPSRTFGTGSVASGLLPLFCLLAASAVFSRVWLTISGVALSVALCCLSIS